MLKSRKQPIDLKMQVAQAALDYLTERVTIGVGTGRTANCFIELLSQRKHLIDACVASSVETERRLKAHGFLVLDLPTVDHLEWYFDGADEVNPQHQMIKGGGGAMTREKIVAAQSECFVCIADASKRVPVLGQFALPVEVIPMASARIMRQFAAMGGRAAIRMAGDKPLVTDNGQLLIDVQGLSISDPLAFEAEVSQWPGVVTVGVFAFQRAHICLLGTDAGVQTLRFD